MNEYRQTAADLHDLQSPISESRAEKFAGYALAFVIGVAIACLLVAWWSS